MITNQFAWQVSTLIAGSLLTALVLAVGHWFPWVRRLERVQAYIYGVSSIIAGFATWRLLNNDHHTVIGLIIIAVIAGCTVISAYKIDAWVIAIRQANKAQRCDKELMSSAESK